MASITFVCFVVTEVTYTADGDAMWEVSLFVVGGDSGVEGDIFTGLAIDQAVAVTRQTP